MPDGYDVESVQTGGDEEEAPRTWVPGSRSQIKASVEKREEYFKGQIRVPTEPTTLQIGSQTITLPRTPPDWQSMIRAEAGYGPEPQNMDRWDELTPSEQQFYESIGTAYQHPIVKGVTGFLEEQEGKPFYDVLQGLAKIPLDIFIKIEAETRKHEGYAYQANFDPELRGAEAINMLFSRGRYETPQSRANLTPRQQKILAAWDIAPMWQQVTAPEEIGEFGVALRQVHLGGEKTKAAISEVKDFLGISPSDPNAEKIVQGWVDEWKAAFEMERQYWAVGPDAAVVPEPTEAQMYVADKYDLDIAGEYFGNENVKERYRRLRKWEKDVAEGGYVDKMGGLPELIKMREQIIAGNDPETVVAAYHQRLGALAGRGQMWEAVFGIIADPINFVPALIKPVQTMHVVRQLALFARVAPEVMDTASDMRRITDTVTDIVRAGENVAELVTPHVDELIEVAGKLDPEVGALSGIAYDIQRAVNKGLGADEIADILKPLDELENMREMSLSERIVLAITGGDPLNPNYGGKLGKSWRSSLNPITLSAEARAAEYMNTVYANMGMLLRNAGDDVVEMAKTFKKAAAGAFGGRFGHMFISPMGRHVQAVYKAISGSMDDLLKVWKQTEKYRVVAGRIGDAIGTDIVDVVSRAGKGSDEARAIYDSLATALRAMDSPAPWAKRMMQEIAEGRFTFESILEIGEILKSTPSDIVPYTADLFRAAVLKAAADHAQNLGGELFGLDEYKWFEKAANYVKAAESLVLLGLNPKYPIQNFFNNEVTSIARGTFGFLIPGRVVSRVPGLSKAVRTIEDVMTDFDLLIPRMHEGYGIPGLDMIEDMAFSVEKAEMWALSTGQQAIRSTRWGKQGKLAKAFMDRTRSFKDLRKLGAVFERMASERATTTSFLKMWPKLWRKTLTKMDDFNPGFASRLDDASPNFSGIVQDGVLNARKQADIQDLKKLKDWRWNYHTVLRRTSEKLGLGTDELSDMISVDVNEGVRHILTDLGTKPTQDAIHTAMNEVRDVVQAGLDELFEAHIPTIVEEAAAKIEANGSKGVIGVYGEVSDAVYSRHVTHMMRLDERVSEIITMTDKTLRNRAWKALKTEADMAWNRTWDFQEAVYKGVVKGLKNRGVDMPEGFIKSFDGLRTNTRDFYKLRDKLWDSFFDDLIGGKHATGLDTEVAKVGIYETLDAEYAKLIDLTQSAHTQMDNVFLGSALDLPEPLLQASQEWRRLVGVARRADMENVQGFRRSIRGLDSVTLNKEWRRFHKARIKEQLRISWLEKFGQSMLDGNEDAFRFFQMNSQAYMLGIADEISHVMTDAENIGVRLTRNQTRMIHAVEKGNDAFKVSLVDGFPEREFAYARIRWGERVDGRIPVELSKAALELPDARLQELLYFELGQTIAETRRYDDELIDLFKLGEVAEEAAFTVSPDVEKAMRRATGGVKDVTNVGDRPYYLSATMRKYYYDPNIGVSRLQAYFEATADDLTAMGRGGAGVEPIAGADEANRIMKNMSASLDDEARVSALFGTDVPDPEAALTRMLREGFGREVEEIADIGTAVHDDISGAVGRFMVDPAGLADEQPEVYEFLQKVWDEDEDIRGMLEAIQNAYPRRMFQDADAVPTLSDFDGIVGKQLYTGIGLDELWFERGGAILNEMESQAISLLDEPAVRIKNLPADVQRDLMNYIDHASGQINDARLATVRVAEGMRDSALLNYTRKYNFDNWFNIVMPFHFWYTHSVARWALHSIDRPWMLAAYAKTREFMEESMGIHKGFPSRLKKHVKVDLPFAPEEFGDIWFNPFRSAGLPFEQFLQPFDRMAQTTQKLEGKVERKLRQMLDAGEIDDQQYEQAMSARSGPLWERVANVVQAEGDDLRFDLLDFMNLSTSPHIPIALAWNIARGTPEEIGVLPHTRSLKHIGTLLGVEPGVYDSLWGNVRKQFGLEGFDQWDDYRVDRTLSNASGEGEITGDLAVRSMIEREGPAFEAAEERTAKEGAFQWAWNTLGIPFKAYPEGEEHLRELYDQFYKALNLRDTGVSPTIVREFFDENPEFESRLALFKEPEERMKQFLVDQVWDRYNDMPSLHKREVRDQLGTQFEELFLDAKSYDSITNDVLGMWLRQMRGDPPGNLAADAFPLEFAPEDAARRLQPYYDYKNKHFPDYYDLNREYWALDPDEWAEKKKYREAYLQLTAGWENRRDFMYRNPDLAPYLEEDPEKLPKYPTIEELRAVVEAQPTFTWGEWQTIVTRKGGHSLLNLVVDSLRGDSMPEVGREMLNEINLELGIEGDWIDLMNRMERSLEVPEVVPSTLTTPQFVP